MPLGAARDAPERNAAARMPRDLSTGLADFDQDAPCGPNLEFDAAFGELERTAQGKPEQQYGDTVIPAEDPDWKDVAAQADALLDRTHDLRVLVLLAIARLQLQGPGEFFAVVGAIRRLITDRWAHVHPQLDPEDDNDPTFRANALLPLANQVRVLRLFRQMPLAASRRDGPVSWRLIGILNGTVEPLDAGERKTESSIRAAFDDTGIATIGARLALYEAGAAEIAGIETAFDANAGYGNAPDLSALAKLLCEIASYLRNFMPAEDMATDSVAGPGLGETDADGEMPPTVRGRDRGSAAAMASLTSIGSRDEAMKLLDLVCRYYETNEPSSPLPLLIDRARKLAGKSFMEILQDLAPDGMAQAQIVVRSRDE